MGRVLSRAAACLALVAAGLCGGGVTAAHAASSISFSDAAGDVLDPALTHDRVTAIPSSTRPYADITNVTAVGACEAVAGVEQLCFTVSTVGLMPQFPVTNGDVGVVYLACFDVPSSEAIANGPVQIGVGHHGEPVFDGPYNSRYGWKTCAWFSEQAGALVNNIQYGVAIYDPIGTYTLYDSSKVSDVCPPSISADTVTFCFPYTWTLPVPPPPPPQVGIPRTHFIQFLSLGDTVNNLTVSTSVGSDASPATSSALRIVDWAPGRQVCTTAGVACVNDDGGSGRGNGFDLGLGGDVYTSPRAVADCDPANVNASCPNVSGTVEYDECYPGPGSNTTQDTGDLYAQNPAACAGGPRVVPWAYQYSVQNGRTLIPNAAGYTNDGASLIA